MSIPVIVLLAFLVLIVLLMRRVERYPYDGDNEP
jgi:hypothetical protein